MQNGSGGDLARGGSVGEESSPGKQLLYSSGRTRVWRVRLPEGQGTRIRKEVLGPGSVTRLRHEVDVLQRLAGLSGVPVLVDVAEDGTSLALGDDGGTSLPEFLRGRRADAPWVVETAIGVAETLTAVHRARVVHQDISPGNILVGGRSAGPVLIDFDLATMYGHNGTDRTSEERITGSLPYLAPEQTGRTARPVDLRADLYALGATLYEVATGEPPFGREDGDVLRLIHAHLAQIPRPADEVNPGVPAALSVIIGRLLEKDPDRRYQSAEGLVHDLKLLRDDLVAGGTGEVVLGARDFPWRLTAPSRLVGRTAELVALLQAYERAIVGGPRGVLIRGGRGVGKSALINEFRPWVSQDGGWFAVGEFEQSHRGLLSGAVSQAVQVLGRLLLAEPEHELAAYRERLRAAVGANFGLIAGEQPEIAALLEVRPLQLEGDPVTLEARIRQAYADLLGVLASSAHPVVLALDQLHHASESALRLVDYLMTDDRLSGLMIVGAYRDDAADASDCLATAVTRWDSLGVLAGSLRVENLSRQDAGTLVAEMLRMPGSEAATFAEAISDRTAGNPYKIVEGVNAMRREGALALGDAGWEWDPATIRRFVDAHEASDLLAERVAKLSQPARSLVETLACLDGVVGIGLLATAGGIDERQIGEHLTPALADGLVEAAPSGDSPAWASVRLRHDRVREAVLARLDAAERAQLHLTIARRLAEDPAHADTAAENFLSAAALLDDPAELHRVSGMFIDVAGRAQVTDPLLADRYLAAARVALDAAQAPDGDALRDRLDHERHAVLFRLGLLAEADDVYASIESRRPDPVVLADSAVVQIDSLTNRHQYQEAVDLGLDLLQRLDVRVPGANQISTEIDSGLDALQQWAQTDPAGDLQRPEITDPRLVAAARIIGRLATPAFHADEVVMAWLVSAAYRLWAERGPCPPLMGMLAGTALVTVGLRQDYRTGYAVLRRIIAVGEARGYEPVTSQVRYSLAASAAPWFEPFEDVLGHAVRARQGALQGGDVQHAGLAFLPVAEVALHRALTVEGLLEDVAAGLSLAARTGNRQAELLLIGYRRFGRAMLGRTGAPGSVSDAEFDEEAHLAELADDEPGICVFHVTKALTAAVFGDGEGLAGSAEAGAELLPYVQATGTTVFLHLVRGLALSERVRASSTPTDREALSGLDASRDWMHARAADAPMNFTHLALWLDAERAWAVGDFPSAARAFEKALRDVASRERPFHQALMTERAAVFHLSEGLAHTAELLLAEARHLYRNWGAVGKVGQLEQQYPFLQDVHITIGTEPSLSLGHSLSVGSDAIDLMAILRASQALSSETNLDRLRASVIQVLTAMTGATLVQVLLWSEESRGWLLPVAAGDATTEGDPLIPLVEAGNRGLVAQSVLRYADRIREPLRLDDATRDDRFIKDPYFSGMDQCSLLVVPVIVRGSPRAMVVLENRLRRGAFSADRVDAVMLIVSQLAVSLDNALAERFRSLVQRSADLTLVCDRHSIVAHASTAAIDLVGVEGVNLTGRAAAELVHADDRPSFLQSLARVAPTEPVAQQLRLTHVQGAERWVECTFTDLSGDPAVGGVMLRLHDITERRQLEAELRRAQKLESVGQLSAGIAHEINTPIQFIGDNIRFVQGAFTELLADARAKDAPPPGTSPRLGVATTPDDEYLLAEIPQALAEALEGTQRVATIVRAMKAFGHPGADHKTDVDLNEAVRNTLIVAGSEIRGVADVAAELADLPPVFCHQGDINQVLLNVIVNAAHAMGERIAQGGDRGTLTIRTRCEPDCTVIEVQDTGVGVPPEIRERVFDMFFTTKPVGHGTGQGLALAHSLVHDRHGGTITFDSTPGIGTTFTIRLPKAPLP
jgi:PAS domain S-box-containing protein